MHFALEFLIPQNKEVAGDRKNPIMAGIAKQFKLSELKQMSNYLGSLQGEMQVVPESRFR